MKRMLFGAAAILTLVVLWLSWVKYHEHMRLEFYQRFTGTFVQVINPADDSFDVTNLLVVNEGHIEIDGIKRRIAQVGRLSAINHFVVGFHDGGFIELTNKDYIYSNIGTGNQLMWIPLDHYVARMLQSDEVSDGFSSGVLYEHWGFYLGPTPEVEPDEQRERERKKYMSYYKEYLKGVEFYKANIKENENMIGLFNKLIELFDINDDNFSRKDDEVKAICSVLINEVSN